MPAIEVDAGLELVALRKFGSDFEPELIRGELFGLDVAHLPANRLCLQNGRDGAEKRGQGGHAATSCRSPSQLSSISFVAFQSSQSSSSSMIACPRVLRCSGDRRLDSNRTDRSWRYSLNRSNRIPY